MNRTMPDRHSEATRYSTCFSRPAALFLLAFITTCLAILFLTAGAYGPPATAIVGLIILQFAVALVGCAVRNIISSQIIVRLARRLAGGQCIHCEYSTTGASGSGRCPECGHETITLPEAPILDGPAWIHARSNSIRSHALLLRSGRTGAILAQSASIFLIAAASARMVFAVSFALAWTGIALASFGYGAAAEALALRYDGAARICEHALDLVNTRARVQPNRRSDRHDPPS